MREVTVREFAFFHHAIIYWSLADLASNVVPPPTMAQIKAKVVEKFGHDTYYLCKEILQKGTRDAS